MKVIKVGDKAPQNQWPKNMTCSHCDSILECEANDVHFESDQRDGDYSWFRCEVCGEKEYVAADIGRQALRANRGLKRFN